MVVPLRLNFFCFNIYYLLFYYFYLVHLKFRSLKKTFVIFIVSDFQTLSTFADFRRFVRTPSKDLLTTLEDQTLIPTQICIGIFLYSFVILFKTIKKLRAECTQSTLHVWLWIIKLTVTLCYCLLHLSKALKEFWGFSTSFFSTKNSPSQKWRASAFFQSLSSNICLDGELQYPAEAFRPFLKIF